MPRVDWDKVPDNDDFKTVPDGTYMVEVVDVEMQKTKNDDEMWRLQLKVIAGEHENACIFDNITFSEKGLKRVKLVVSRLGLKTEGQEEILPDHLVGQRCWVDVTLGSYMNKEGKEVPQNKVPFSGYDFIDGKTLTEQQKITSPGFSNKPQDLNEVDMSNADDIPF